MLENLQFFPTYHRGIREPGFAYGLFLVILPIISVKIAMTRRQSAGVRSISTSEASQRLHAEDLTISHPPAPLSNKRERGAGGRGSAYIVDLFPPPASVRG